MILQNILKDQFTNDARSGSALAINWTAWLDLGIKQNY